MSPALLGLVLSATLLVMITSLGFALLAPPASAETTIKATPLIDDAWVPGRHVTVLVTVTSDRLVQATLRVKTKEPESSESIDVSFLPNTLQRTGAVVVEQPVELPGGSEKQFVAVLPAEIDDVSDLVSTELPSLQLKVELAQGDTVLARDTVTIRPQQTVQGVGVLPVLASNTKVPERVDLAPDTIKAHLVTLSASPSPLDSGAAALEQLSTIIGSAEDLSAINKSEVQRAALLQWVNRGGHLVIDATAGPIEGLPDAWQPGPGGFAHAGAGDVRLSNGHAKDGKWNLAVLAGRAGVDLNTDPTAILSFIPGIPMQDGLGKDAGFRLPDLGALVIFLVVYVVLVGPVTFMILARADKRAWAWVCVPVLAVLFTGVFSVSGAKLRNTTEASHATLIEVGPSGSTAFTSALVGSVTGGRTTVELGRGWSADTADSGSKNAGKPPALTMGTNGLEAQLNLEPGSFSTIRATGPTGHANALEVKAHVEGSAIVGTVTNNLDVDLEEVAVMVGFSAEKVGTVPARGTTAFTVERPRQTLPLDSTRNAGLPELAVWTAIEPEALSAWGIDCNDPAQINNNTGSCVNPLDMSSNRFGGDIVCDANGCGPRQATTTVPPPANPLSPLNAAVWIDHLRRDHGALRRFGAVTVAGWTDQLDAPIHLSGGQAIRRGRTAVVARGAVEATELTAATVRRETIRTGNVNNMNGGFEGQVGGASRPATAAAYRLLMPVSVAGSPITSDQVLVRLPESIGAARILTPDGWLDYVRQPFSSSKLEIPLPVGSIMSGVVIIQVDQAENSNTFSGSGVSTDWQIRVLRAGEREKLEKNLAAWKEQQDAYNRDNPPQTNRFPDGSVSSSDPNTGAGTVTIDDDSGATSTAGTVPSVPVPPAVPTTAVNK